jgi:hypothetical protein
MSEEVQLPPIEEEPQQEETEEAKPIEGEPLPPKEREEEASIESKPKAKEKAPPKKKSEVVIDVVPIVPEPVVPAEPVVMKKPRGHRKKDPNTVDMKTKTTCPDCNKTISIHNLNYTHKKVCKGANKPPAPTPVDVNPQEILKQSNFTVEQPPAPTPYELLKEYDTQQRKQTLETKRNKLKSLVASALPG